MHPPSFKNSGSFLIYFVVATALILFSSSSHSFLFLPVINASFVKASYVLLEGGNNLIMPLVNTSESSTKPVVLDLLQGNCSYGNYSNKECLYRMVLQHCNCTNYHFLWFVHRGTRKCTNGVQSNLFNVSAQDNWLKE